VLNVTGHMTSTAVVSTRVDPNEMRNEDRGVRNSIE
jgi:hypothetical protein